MTELDFDELDKAVNSLMVDGVEPTTSTDTAVVSSPADTQVPGGVADGAEPVTSTIDTPQPSSAAPSLATKRRGQFMDMIHPSSDMKTKSFSGTGSVRHQSTVVTPSSTMETASSSSFAAAPTVEAAPSEPISVPDDVEPSTTSDAAGTSEWPDPLDVATKDTSSETSETPETADAVEVSAPQPLDSPFLADAKPEKRPLGSMSSLTDGVDTLEKPIDPYVDAQTIPTVPDVKQPVVLPDELHSNVVSIESDTTVPMENTPNQAAEPTQPTDEPAQTPKPVEAKPINGSIPQQYKEELSTGDQANGAIYDTANYHKAIEAHASGKKGSTMKWIIWVVLLLVVGAGGGAAFFMFTR